LGEDIGLDPHLNGERHFAAQDFSLHTQVRGFFPVAVSATKDKVAMAQTRDGILCKGAFPLYILFELF